MRLDDNRGLRPGKALLSFQKGHDLGTVHLLLGALFFRLLYLDAVLWILCLFLWPLPKIEK